MEALKTTREAVIKTFPVGYWEKRRLRNKALEIEAAVAELPSYGVYRCDDDAGTVIDELVGEGRMCSEGETWEIPGPLAYLYAPDFTEQEGWKASAIHLEPDKSHFVTVLDNKFVVDLSQPPDRRVYIGSADYLRRSGIVLHY